MKQLLPWVTLLCSGSTSRSYFDILHALILCSEERTLRYEKFKLTYFTLHTQEPKSVAGSALRAGAL